MPECRRCNTETPRRTLAGEALCESCADWYEEHDRSREADQHGLGEWGGA